MIIRIEEQRPGALWVVHLDACQVGFSRLGDAQAFVNRLQARIDAPHAWPSVDNLSRPGARGDTRVTPDKVPAQVCQ